MENPNATVYLYDDDVHKALRLRAVASDRSEPDMVNDFMCGDFLARIVDQTNDSISSWCTRWLQRRYEAEF